MKSASETLHEFLNSCGIDFEFTAEELQTQTGFTRGSITGFIAKAQKHGMIAPITKIKREGMRSITMYKVIDPHVTWRFKPKSHGSYKGRTVKSHSQIELPLAGNVIEVNHDNYHPEMIKRLPVFDPSAVPHADLPSTNPISSRLIDIAAEVERLENKSLKDYSTDEILAELGTRLK